MRTSGSIMIRTRHSPPTLTLPLTLPLPLPLPLPLTRRGPAGRAQPAPSG